VKHFIVILILWFCCGQSFAQNSTGEKKDSLPKSENKNDSLSGFDRFNKKAEHFGFGPGGIQGFNINFGEAF